MIKVRIHIFNRSTRFDIDVYVDAEIPIPPFIGMRILLNQQQLNELHSKAMSSYHIANRYAPQYLMGDWYHIDENTVHYTTLKNMPNCINFKPCIEVSRIGYDMTSGILHIILKPV